MAGKYGIHNYNLEGLDTLEILRLAVYQQKLANDRIKDLERQLDDALDRLEILNEN